jgi:hypothetical protein
MIIDRGLNTDRYLVEKLFNDEVYPYRQIAYGLTIQEPTLDCDESENW